MKAILKDRRKTNKFINTRVLSPLDVKSFSNRSFVLDRNSDHQGKAEKKQLYGHVEFLEETENDEATSDNNPPSNINIEIDHEMSSLSLVHSNYSKSTSHISEKKEEKARRQQKTASAVVNGGALTFVVLAAVLVTTSFLMSPVIEEIFGKH